MFSLKTCNATAEYSDKKPYQHVKKKEGNKEQTKQPASAFLFNYYIVAWSLPWLRTIPSVI